MIPGLQESIEQIVDLITEEAKSVPLERILLGGISQGCATALFTLLSSDLRLGCFIGLSSWLPFEKRVEAVSVELLNSVSGISRQIQQILKIPQGKVKGLQTGLSSSHSAGRPFMFLSHSRDDETIPFRMGETLHKRMQLTGLKVVWREYEDGGHWIHPERGVDDIAAFLHDSQGI